MSAPLDFKLHESRAVSVLFTALFPAPATAADIQKGKEGEKNSWAHQGVMPQRYQGASPNIHPASNQVTDDVGECSLQVA